MPPKKQAESDVEDRPLSPTKGRRMKAAASKSPGRGRPATPKTPKKTPRSASRGRPPSASRKALTEPAPPRPASRSGTRGAAKKEKEVKLTNKTIVVETTPVLPKSTRITRSVESRSILKATPKIETRSSRSRAEALTANTAGTSISVAAQMTSEEEKALRRRITAAASVSPSVPSRAREVARETAVNAKNVACRVVCSNAFKVVLGIFILFTAYYFVLKYFPNIHKDSAVYITNNYYYVRDQAAEGFNKAYQSLPSFQFNQQSGASTATPAKPVSEN
ncbi:hypothetical protein QR680_008458 [Steinernema hermaphroditum]|uniref:Uncharacterized protein n=1 Tax=Steinernema hermaphroditum TaxID=289476 RepID=A0AA39IIX5_9BILA|nr:hypothetical protein QR680_008458 [Steinernema hermaphroditum]